MAHPTIDQLVTNIKSVLGEAQQPADIAAAVAALAKPLAEDQSWVEPRCYETEDAQGIGVTILHSEPDHTLMVETVCWQAGSGVAPHDHQTWGVVLGLDGEEVNTTWRRLDDGKREGHAELERAAEVSVRRGDVVQLMPDDIHSVTNKGQTDSLSLHIYGRDLAHVSRSEFDPLANIQRPCPQRIRNR